MKVYAPGKLILSGEHAIVHGQPALAMAVNRYAVASVGTGPLSAVSLHLADLSHSSLLTWKDLATIKNKLKRKYLRFIRGEYHIRDVLRKPFELAHAALGILAGTQNFSLPDGMKIHVTSDIPIGSGMGSSAASILCVMKAATLHLDIPVSTDILYQMALEAENLQHGNSSGLDLRVSLHGGCVYVHGDQIEQRAVPDMQFYLVNTGAPASTTGECVQYVESYFANQELADQFGQVTNAMDAALQNKHQADLQSAIRRNHQLLTQIGVVPQRVQQFIEQIEEANGAAKICGAGAVAGDRGGIVMVVMDDAERLAALCRQFHYELIPVQGETRGMHVI
jgi:mevalonate kinase